MPTTRALIQLYRLLEENAPSWYTQEHHEMAEAALKAQKDYATEPYSASEISPRFEASLRTPQTSQGVHDFGHLRVDLGRMEVRVNNQLIHLATREFQLLRYLVERTGITVSRTELLRYVWGYDAASFTRTLDVHVASLRKKLETDPGSPQMIITVKGMGYRFDRR
jgi:DNA-binding response OmpR family regulator